MTRGRCVDNRSHWPWRPLREIICPPGAKLEGERSLVGIGREDVDAALLYK